MRIAFISTLVAAVLVALPSAAFASTTPVGPTGQGALIDVTGNYQLIVNGVPGPVFHATSNPDDTVFVLPRGTQVIVFGFAPDGKSSSCLNPVTQTRNTADGNDHHAICELTDEVVPAPVVQPSWARTAAVHP